MARARSEDGFGPAGPIRALGYRLVWSVIWLLEKAANACLYVAVGLLRKSDLQAAAQARWAMFGTLDEYADAGLEPWEERLYSSVLRGGDRVLIIGCGGGRDLLPFCARGCTVTGVERVPVLAAAARRHLDRHGMEATVIESSIETAELSGMFDVIIFSAFVFAYLDDPMLRVSTLERLKARLSNDGRIILTYTDAVPRARLGLALTRTVARLTGNDWRPGAEDTFARGPARLPLYERALSSASVCAELAAAGLRIISDDLSGTRRSIIAAVAT
jgi:SAM-dependent methyltransferase